MTHRPTSGHYSFTWAGWIAALPAQFAKVRLAAAELMATEAVYVKILSCTLKTAD